MLVMYLLVILLYTIILFVESGIILLTIFIFTYTASDNQNSVLYNDRLFIGWNRVYRYGVYI